MSDQEEVKKFRLSRNDFLIKSSESPIPTETREKIGKLPFFPIKDEFRVNVDLNLRSKPKEADVVNMVGITKTVSRIGKIEFHISGSNEKHALEVYEDPEEKFIFTIFGDLTNNSNETYGAGRYVKIEKDSTGAFIVDFNKAISPYCSYSEKYPCPLPPRKNRLNMRIDAGEKYIGDH